MRFATSRTARRSSRPLHERLIGRYLCEDFVDAETGEVLVSKDKMMTDDDAQTAS